MKKTKVKKLNNRISIYTKVHAFPSIKESSCVIYINVAVTKISL